MNDEPKTIRTKGDANPASIPGTDFPITEEEYIGKVAYTLPQVGYVTQLLKPPINYDHNCNCCWNYVCKTDVQKRKSQKEVNFQIDLDSDE